MSGDSENQFEEYIEQAVGRVVDQVLRFPEQERPMGTRKLTQAEQLERYRDMRDNPQAWLAFMEEHGVSAALEYAEKMEKRDGNRD